MRKPDICVCKNKGRISTAELISVFIFEIYRVQFPFYLNAKFQASCHLWLYSLFLSDLVGKHEDRFSHDAAQLTNHSISATQWC